MAKNKITIIKNGPYRVSGSIPLCKEIAVVPQKTGQNPFSAGLPNIGRWGKPTPQSRSTCYASVVHQEPNHIVMEPISGPGSMMAMHLCKTAPHNYLLWSNIVKFPDTGIYYPCGN